MIDFGTHLKSLRKSRKLTQKQLATAIGVTERGLQSYELNEKKPSFDNLIAMADYFDVSVDYLMGRTAFPLVLREEIVEIYSPEEMELVRKHREQTE